MAAICKSPYSDAIKYPDVSLHQLLLDKAAEEPDRVAMINAATEESVTYGEMVRSVEQLSGALCCLGVQKSDVVCICTTNSPKTVLSMLAVFRAGATVTGINPAFTVGEMVRQFEDSNTVHMITTPDIVNKAEMARQRYPALKKIVVIGQCEGYTTYQDLMSMKLPADLGVRTVNPEDLAFLPYSSGTTGAPKGVMLTHRNLSCMTQILNHPDVEAFGQRQRTLSVFPLYHVGGFIINMANALYALSTVVYIPKYTFTNYLRALQKYKIQVTNIPPPILVLLVKSPEVAHYDLSNLHSVLVGAAPVSPDLVTSIIDKHGVQFRQCYGMTETTCLTHVTPRGVINVASTGPPLPNTECKIVRVSDGSTADFGEEGEVMVRGPNIMAGYLNNPEATARTLTPDGWIHTGDIGYMTEDGFLYIRDRMKEVIKYKGYQVPPAELESLLLSHPDVADAAVIGVPDEDAGELPRGYVVIKLGHQTDIHDIQTFVKERVAPYKQLRGGVRVVPAIPKSPTGKILRRKLRDQVRKEAKTKSKL